MTDRGLTAKSPRVEFRGLPLGETAEDFILRRIEKLNHSAARCKESYRCLTQHHTACSSWRRGNRHLVGMKNVADHPHIEFEEEREIGPLGTGCANAANDRKFDRCQ